MADAFRLALLDGGALYIGRGITTGVHRHHATELVMSIEHPFRLEAPPDAAVDGRFALVPPNVPHRFVGAPGDVHVFVYLDPLHQWARQLAAAFPAGPTVRDLTPHYPTALVPPLLAWLGGGGAAAEAVVAGLVRHVVPEAAPLAPLDARIAGSLVFVQNRLPHPLPLPAVAAHVHLSAGRYAHLFTQQVGVPFRRYVRWSRLQATVRAVLQGHSLTQACYDGGFTDLPHFTRTFRAMFGVAPSEVIRPRP